ncbi:acyltransferase [Pseudoroseicyclus aestuarii]|uniref:Transferase family hexapeptide repeat protein n=1 Tax=Pseudoroseicyclus aestuarii TaxID=1795041 RepID=A0A318T0L3_9RHOB|nr:transferase family hexapeptide repeat protein [Pseudoroseicyclus aestuarii]
MQARRIEYLPWERTPHDCAAPAQQQRHAALAEAGQADIDPTAFVAEGALVFTERLTLGPGCIVAAQALLRGELHLGADCSINPFACLSGRITCGSGVRIASHATLVGFDHGIDDPDLPIHRQPLRIQGIEIGDDVWIGANAVILDGARIGSGAVIAAGAVVRGTVEPRAIMGGVPARLLRHRPAPALSGPAPLAALGRRAAAQWQDVLASHSTPEGYVSTDAAGRAGPDLRHLCDAIEIAAGFGGAGALPGRDAAVARLKDSQDATTGLFPDPARPHEGALRDDPIALYNVLAAGYALHCLGTAPARPVAAVEIESAELRDWLDALPWADNPWGAGATVDAIGTALTFNANHFGLGRGRDTLLGWLALAADPATGLWGRAIAGDSLLAVNGFYRASRSTHAQTGIPLPYPERSIDSVLANYNAHQGFAGSEHTACNLLDTVHPLWLCLRQTRHRRAEAEAIACTIITRTAARWQDGRGIGFAEGQAPSLQGTEMWLATVHTAAAILKEEDAFPFVPRGVHRLAPPTGA